MTPRMLPARGSRRNRELARAAARGWSLIELMVVVAVLTALTLAAVPAWRSTMLRAQRVEATSALVSLATAQERHFLQHNTYAADIDAAPPDGLGIPATTSGGRYALAITSADAAAFNATATAQGRQARDTHCAEFAIDATGAKTATNEDCWAR
jgi:type IV pilus assembly protein PilE